MASRRRLPRGAHVLMWSSPLLLLVMLFTLSATSTVPSTSTSTPPSGPTTSTSRAPSTSTTTGPTTTVAGRPSTPSPTTTLASSGPRSSSSTAGSGPPAASAAAWRPRNGALSGTLREGGSVAVPLGGPAHWRLQSGEPVIATLRCPLATTSILGTVEVPSHATCQLELHAPATTTWTLIPLA